MSEDTSKNVQQVGRLAFRAEGDMWVAYYAQPDTMDDAITLGSLRLAIAVHSSEAKQAFIDLMTTAVGDQVELAVGVRPTWGAPATGPEHERAGRA
jgi:hypothetical protein